MLRNPFDKFLGKEQKLQIEVCVYLRSQYPKILWFHAMNEGKRSKFEQYLFLKMGAKSGCPDLLIFTPNTIFNGLAIELKIKPNTTTVNQKEFLKKLSDNGWCTQVCYTFDDAKKSIDNYLHDRRL